MSRSLEVIRIRLNAAPERTSVSAGDVARPLTGYCPWQGVRQDLL